MAGQVVGDEHQGVVQGVHAPLQFEHRNVQPAGFRRLELVDGVDECELHVGDEIGKFLI